MQQSFFYSGTTLSDHFVVVLFSIAYLALSLRTNNHSGVLALLSACVGYIRHPWSKSMNKIIYTNPHCFISIVGPGGCGKTHLVSQIILNQKTFSSRASRMFCTFTNTSNLITNHFYWDVHAKRYQSKFTKDLNGPQ